MKDGSFLSSGELESILTRWRAKKNLVLQGPPGTGKTWLAKRLGFALVGSDDEKPREAGCEWCSSHPSLAYEDFVRGWRPPAKARSLIRRDLHASDRCRRERAGSAVRAGYRGDEPGNPAQIFGELLTLLEDSKRRPSEAIELAYRRAVGERVHVPENLYVIRTMMSPTVTRHRRFSPASEICFCRSRAPLGPAWRDWCSRRGS